MNYWTIPCVIHHGANFYKALFNSGPQCFNLMGNELYVKANAAISEAALRKRLISITVKVGNKKRY